MVAARGRNVPGSSSAIHNVTCSIGPCGGGLAGCAISLGVGWREICRRKCQAYIPAPTAITSIGAVPKIKGRGNIVSLAFLAPRRGPGRRALQCAVGEFASFQEASGGLG